jgi:hypothetical protein
MLSLGTSTLLLGAALAMRFRAPILVPTLGFVFAAILIVGLMGGNRFIAIATAAALASCCLQAGYLLIAFARFGMASYRSPKPGMHRPPIVH